MQFICFKIIIIISAIIFFSGKKRDNQFLCKIIILIYFNLYYDLFSCF